MKALGLNWNKNQGMSTLVMLILLSVFSAVAFSSLTGSFSHMNFAQLYETSVQVKLDTDLIFDEAVEDLRLGSDSFAWGSENIPGTKFNGVDVVPIDNSALNVYPVPSIAAKSFSVERTWALNSGTNATYRAACFSNCGTVNGVKQWYVHILSASEDFTQKKTAVVALKKGNAIWDLTASGLYDDPIYIPATTSWGEGLKLTDINGDSFPDILLNGTPQVMLGQGDGTFTNGVNFEPGFAPFNIEAGDFNGDGVADVAYHEFNNPNLRIRFGNGDGTFGAASDYANTAPTVVTAEIEIADVNADGHPDIVTTNPKHPADLDPTNDRIGIRLNNGDGTFAAQVTYTDPVTNMNSTKLADFNSDGKMDMIVQHGVSTGTTLYLGNGDGTFAAGVSTGLLESIGKNPAIGDFNEDGKADFTAFQSDFVKIFPGNGDGTFGANTSLSTGSHNVMSGHEATTRAIDIDADGHLDIITASNVEGTVSIHMGNGDMTFQSRNILTATPNLAEFEVIDLNGDGLLDIITRQQSNLTTHPLTVFLQHAPTFTARVLQVASKNY